jgi:serine/threonine protein kinase
LVNEPPSPRAAKFIGATLCGRYRIDRVISDSPRGALLCGEDAPSKRRVALRVIYPEVAATAEGRAIIEREAAVAARVKQHPAIAAGVTAGTTEDGSKVLVMHEVGGVTLRTISGGETLPLARAAVLMKQLALALEALHSAGIIHRALSPDCILVLASPEGDRDTVKLTDFSCAKIDAGSPGPLLDPDSPALTYASPEVKSGHDVDSRSDFYALGLLFYELVTGSRPTLERTGSLPSMTSIRSVPVAVDALALRLLADDPGRRVAIAMDVVKALDALADPAPASPPPPPASGEGAASSPGGTASSPRSSPSSSSRGQSGPALSAPKSGPVSRSSGAAPISAVTAHVVSTAMLEGSGAPQDVGHAPVPFRIRLYAWGSIVVVFLVVAAILVRSPTAETEEAPAEPRSKPRAGAPAAKEALSPAPPASPEDEASAREIRARIEKSMRVGNTSAFVADMERLFEIDPTAATDRDLRSAIVEVLMRIMMGDGAEAERLFTLIGTKMGTAGPDLLFELVTTRGGSRAAKRAEEMLRDEALRSRGTPALRIAYDLRFAKGCEERISLLERAREDGDRRTLGQLQILSNQECRRGECCLQTDPGFKPAMEAIKERLR